MRRLLTTTLALTALFAGSVPVAQAEFGFAPGSFEVAFTNEDESPADIAGSHPFAQITSFEFNTVSHPSLGVTPDGALKDQVYAQIEGLVGDATAMPRCTIREFLSDQTSDDYCADETAVGIGYIQLPGSIDFPEPTAVFNLEPPAGYATRLGLKVLNVPVVLLVSVNPDPPHNLLVTSPPVTQTIPFYAAEVTIWGDPSDPVHDNQRGQQCARGLGNLSCPVPRLPRPFLTSPRACTGPLATTYEIASWQDPTNPVTGLDPLPEEFTGCASLGFAPDPAAAPTTNRAESPSGFDFSIDVDDPGLTSTAPGARADSDLKRAVVTLPKGLAVNPAAAGGLEACTRGQLAGETASSAPGEGCPEASKVASVQVQTPLLEEQLTGSIFLAEPFANPLGELLAGYLVIKQPERGIVVKITGRIEADPLTGQLVSSFDENPQLPFSRLEVSFPPGPRAPLTTPSTCGAYEIKTELHPWSGNAPVVEKESFQITQAAGGGSCPTTESALPNAPGFDAGTVEPLAGRHSPFVLNLRRDDGSQRFSAVNLTPPPGLTAKLAGTPPCSDAALAAAASKSGKAEQASPSCPSASRIGSVLAAAGSGPAPYRAAGDAYLAAPYKGAPLSLAVITPAVAGPFDLGTVVVRTALRVDPRTAQITATSDPLPELLQGIPLDVRQIQIRLDKPGFTLNPTSCDPMALSGSLLSTLGQTASLSNRFQVAECGRLGFKPKLALKLKGGTKRGDNQKLIADVRTRAGDANIARTQVTLPRSAFLDQSHIRTICTRVQWASDSCPKGSIYGRAKATSPLLDYPIAGNVYLRSSDNKLPDLVADLRGPAHQPIRIELVGRTDAVKGALRNTFDIVPDAPASTFRLELFGGKRGLVVNSRDICARPYKAIVAMAAHNGAAYTARPELKARCGGKGRKGGKRGKANRSATRPSG